MGGIGGCVAIALVYVILIKTMQKSPLRKRMFAKNTIVIILSIITIMAEPDYFFLDIVSMLLPFAPIAVVSVLGIVMSKILKSKFRTDTYSIVADSFISCVAGGAVGEIWLLKDAPFFPEGGVEAISASLELMFIVGIISMISGGLTGIAATRYFTRLWGLNNSATYTVTKHLWI